MKTLIATFLAAAAAVDTNTDGAIASLDDVQTTTVRRLAEANAAALPSPATSATTNAPCAAGEFAARTPIDWVDRGGGATSHGSEGGLQKLGGTDGWNAGAVSQRKFAGDVTFDFKCSPDAHSMIGFAKGANTDYHSDIDCAMYTSNGMAYTRELGVYKSSIGVYSASTAFMMKRVGSVVQFFKDGALLRTCGQTMSGTLRVDTSLYYNRVGILEARLDESADAGVGCTGCPAGKFQPAGGAPSCSVTTTCAPGSYVSKAPNAMSDRECTVCDKGKFSSAPNEATCTAHKVCAAGEFASFAGSTFVDRECTPCAAGTSQSGTNQPNCAPCATGEFQNQNGATTCKDCDGSSGFTASAGSRACLTSTTCAPGSYVSMAPTAISDRVCSPCAENFFSNTENAAQCTAHRACAAGEYASFAGSKFVNRMCTTCPAGRYQNEADQPSCKDCLAGQHQPVPGTQSCQICAIGQYQQATGTKSCKNCGIGRHGDANKDAATDEHCTKCAKGTFQAQEGQSTCESWSTLSCPGSAERVGGSPFADRTCQFTSCPSGRWGANAQSIDDCKDCDAGATDNKVNGKCVVGFYQDDTSSACACKACPPGTHAMTKGAVGRCTNCPVGTHQSATGATSCSFCTAGTASEVVGAVSDAVCAPCGYGSFSAQGAPVCSTCPGNADVSSAMCPSGKFRRNTQISCDCTNCPAGEHNPDAATSATSGATSCAKCDAGTFAPEGQNVQCNACDDGKHAPTKGRAYCSACPVGTSFDAATKACQPCGAGRFQNVAGQVACKTCECNKYQNDEGATYCKSCVHGTDGVGSTACVARAANAPACAGAGTPAAQLAPPLFLPMADIEGLTPAVALDAVQDMVIQGQQAQASALQAQAFAQTTKDELKTTKQELAAAEAAKAVLQGVKEACEARAGATIAAPTTGAVASCAGSVTIDTNGNGKVESADAVELFVASTMQDFGAAQVIESFRAKYSTGAVTAVKTILANVKAAMAATARADNSAATTL